MHTKETSAIDVFYMFSFILLDRQGHYVDYPYYYCKRNLFFSRLIGCERMRRSCWMEGGWVGI